MQLGWLVWLRGAAFVPPAAGCDRSSSPTETARGSGADPTARPRTEARTTRAVHDTVSEAFAKQGLELGLIP